MPEGAAPALALLALGAAAGLLGRLAALSSLLLGFVCGGAACLLAARSRRLRLHARTLETYLLSDATDQPAHHKTQRACTACGEENCGRHEPEISFEPWAGLRLHKQLDQAIEDFYNAILENFVSTWYSKITTQPFFMDELRHQLRYASAALLRRAYKINYSKLIIDKLVPCALHHHEVWVAAQRHKQRFDGADISMSSSDFADVERAALSGPLRCGVHPAVGSRADELRYLRCVTTAIMPFLLRPQEVQNRVFQVLIREIFAGWALLPLTDVLADPYILNTLIILATGNETMSVLPKTPNYRVEFLDNFVRQPECVYTRRSKLLRVDLDTVLNNQEYFYAFMQFMKTTGHFHLLQFCKDIKPFQMKILNPELTANEEVSLFNEAWDLYVQYFDAGSSSAVPFDSSIVEEMCAVLSEGAANVKKLQTSKALYQSSRYADSVLENVWIPRFLHSEEFYKLFYGARVPTGYHKQMTKKPQEKLVSTAIKLGNKLKGALKPQTIDGQILDCFTNSIDINTEFGVSDGDSMENMDILRYLDSLSESTRLAEHDLSNCRVSLTRAELRQMVGRSGTIRVFTVSVERARGAGGAGGALRCVERTENDFHLLRSKLAEFHGDALMRGLVLPSRRDNSPLETLRYKYEDFIQQLMQKSLLTTSELLHIFLSANGDFCSAVQQASLGGAGPDLANMYQSMAHRLRKEKGQHLEPFMSAYLLSSDVERYQAMKQGTSRDVEEAEEINDEVQFERVVNALKSAHKVRDITQSRTFENNFNLERRALVERVQCTYQSKLTGFTQCLMFLLLKVVGARGVVCGAVGSVCALLCHLIDHWFNLALNHLLASVLSHQRLAHLIRLGHDLLFVNKPEGRQHEANAHREHARALLHRAPPRIVCELMGPGLHPAIDSAHDMLQSAKLNKQLLFNLFDLCVAELFPELTADASPRGERDLSS